MTDEERIISDCENHVMTNLMDLYETGLVNLSSLELVKGAAFAYTRIYDSVFECNWSLAKAGKIIDEIAETFTNWRNAKEELKS